MPHSATVIPAGQASRNRAFRMLRAVLKRGQTVEQAWAAETDATLSSEDAGFARALVLAALRRHGQHEALLQELLKTPLPAKAADLTLLLELGLTQLLWMGVPAHAAVHATVELARNLRFDNYCGLVNAILQRVSREMAVWWEKSAEQTERNLPSWMVGRLRHAYGEDVLAELLVAQVEYGSTTPPVLDVSVKHADGIVPEGAELLPTGSWRLQDAGRVESLAGYAEGTWWVQDAAAALPARLLLASVPPGVPLLDACAAPGGKTAQLAAAGHPVTALDLHAKRLARLDENMARLGLAAERVKADALLYAPATRFAGALLDAPCSATGTIRRHPELPWQRQPADIARLLQLQANMLRQAASWLAPGGVLVYAVCSLLPEEGEAQIDMILNAERRFERLPVTDAELDALGLMPEMRTRAGDLRTLPSHWPERGGLDGFYIARLRLAASAG